MLSNDFCNLAWTFYIFCNTWKVFLIPLDRQSQKREPVSLSLMPANQRDWHYGLHNRDCFHSLPVVHFPPFILVGDGVCLKKIKSAFKIGLGTWPISEKLSPCLVSVEWGEVSGDSLKLQLHLQNSPLRLKSKHHPKFH